MVGSSTDENYLEPDICADMYSGEDYLEKDLPSPPQRTRKRSSRFSKRSSGVPLRSRRRSSLVTEFRKGTSDSALPRDSPGTPRRSSQISLPKRASLAAPPGHEIYVTQEVGPDGSQIFTPRMRQIRSSVAESVGKRLSTDPRPRSAVYDGSDSEADSNSEEHDDGGPRYTSAKHNQDLDRAVRRTSAPESGSWRSLKQRSSMKPNRHSDALGIPVTRLEMLSELQALDESSSSLHEISSTAFNDSTSSEQNASGSLDTTQEMQGENGPEVQPRFFPTLGSDVSNDLEVLEEGGSSSSSSND